MISELCNITSCNYKPTLQPATTTKRATRFYDNATLRRKPSSLLISTNRNKFREAPENNRDVNCNGMATCVAFFEDDHN